MFLRFSRPRTAYEALYYNEQKVRQQVAECIYAANFLKNIEELKFEDKQERFDALTAWNQRIRHKILHISLNISPKDQIDNEKMAMMGEEFMLRAGYGEQPYLIYRHLDAGHPHMHIVTTKIRPDGRGPGMSHRGRNNWEVARMAIEEKFGLFKLVRRKQKLALRDVAMSPEMVTYGEKPTVEAMTGALRYILNNYRYRTFAELNAVLRIYNLFADEGRPGSKLRKNGGLVYSILDKHGKRKGIPIKASALDFKPGKIWLEAKFKEHAGLDEAVTLGTKRKVEAALKGSGADPERFKKTLGQGQVAASVIGEGDEAVLFYVDLANKKVVDSRELGVQYELAAIRANFDSDPFVMAPARDKIKAKSLDRPSKKKHRGRKL
jgi:hypothetical protein